MQKSIVPIWRVRKMINEHARFCDLDPEDFDRNDIRMIADRAQCPQQQVVDYINYWYLGVDW